MVKIEIQKRTVYFWVAMIILLGGIFGVYAALGSVPNPGHAVSELQTCGDGEILQTSGGNWACVDMPSGGGSSLWSESGGDISYTGGDVYIGGSDDEAYIDGGATIENGLLVKSGGAQITGGNVDVSNDLSVGGSLYGWAIPSDIRLTTASHSGDFSGFTNYGNAENGYQAVYNWIQSKGCSGYHVCDGLEITRYLQVHGELPVEFNKAWYNSGVFSFTQEGHEHATHDCEGWHGVDAYDKGSVWWNDYGSRDQPDDEYCSSYTGNPRPFLCCKY